MSLDNLKTVVSELADVREKIKALQEIESGHVTLLKRAINTPTETLVGDVLLTIAFKSGRTSYDYAAMEADGINIEKYKKVGAPSSVLTVKRVTVTELR